MSFDICVNVNRINNSVLVISKITKPVFVAIFLFHHNQEIVSFVWGDKSREKTITESSTQSGHDYDVTFKLCKQNMSFFY